MLLIAALLLQAHAPPVFQSSVEMVRLTLTAQDKKTGRYITNLKAEDIQIVESGKVQTPILFTSEQLPVSVVIMIDSSFSMLRKIDIAKAAAVNFIRNIRPQDEAQIISFATTSSIVQDYSSDQKLLTAAINSIEVGDTTSLYNCLWIRIKELTKRERDKSHRRAIIVLTDGDDNTSLVSDDQVLELAHKSEVNVYAISLETFNPVEVSISAAHGQHFLKSLSEDTGGQLFRVYQLRDLKGKYELIASDLSVQYSIGYVSTNPVLDSKPRNISIIIPRIPNLDLHYRTTYIPTKNRR